MKNWIGAFLVALELANEDRLSTICRWISTAVLTVLVVLKCADLSSWSWFWVLSPLWISPLAYLVFVGVRVLWRRIRK